MLLFVAQHGLELVLLIAPTVPVLMKITTEGGKSNFRAWKGPRFCNVLDLLELPVDSPSFLAFRLSTEGFLCKFSPEFLLEINFSS